MITFVTRQTAFGQDIHFSQYQAGLSFFNPGNVGAFSGNYRGALLYRQQWRSVTVPFVTTGLALDGKIKSNDRKSFNLGLSLYQDKAGDGNLVSNSIQLMPGYGIHLGSDSTTFLNIGVSLGYLMKGFNFSKYTWDNQFDGEKYDALLTTGEALSSDNAGAIDLGAGFSFLKRVKENFSIGFGAGAMHINSPQFRFVNSANAKYPMHLMASLFTSHQVNRQFTLTPSVAYMKQQSLTEVMAGANAFWKTKKATALIRGVKAGLHYRLNDAAIAMVGCMIGNFDAGISYDVNISDWKRATNNRGATEVSLVYTFSKIKKIKPSVPCIIN
ncbi:MAG: PorP/SprF family type IX secretion system membrane protein [Bacteroidetes bacterium]|nr:PorP/SprF family type IX secretion system membrane protein [Bacteroidota bacterium]